jgi:RNA polymerase sigma factor (sigma-70 family)
LFASGPKASDQKLIKLCQKGQSPAWDLLVERYQRLVYHFPSDAGLSQEDCEEVLQETFLAAYQALDKLSEVSHMGRWLAVVSQRTTWRLIQNKKRRKENLLNEEIDVADPQETEKDLEIKIQQDLIRKGLAKLNEKCQKLIHLLFFRYESKDYDQIAAEAGIPKGSIGPIRQRCLAKFKSHLANMGINEKNVSRWLK